MVRFVLQLVPGHRRWSFEEEAMHLDRLARQIQELVEYPVTIRHDRQEFAVYIGQMLFKWPRRSNALTWTAKQTRQWVMDVANRWSKAAGRPPLEPEDGNRLCTTIEETSGPVGDVLEPINRNL